MCLQKTSTYPPVTKDPFVMFGIHHQLQEVAQLARSRPRWQRWSQPTEQPTDQPATERSDWSSQAGAPASATTDYNAASALTTQPPPLKLAAAAAGKLMMLMMLR